MSNSRAFGPMKVCLGVPARWLVLLATALLGPGAAGGEADDRKSAEAKGRPRVDRYGDPLPDGAIARLGSSRLRHGFVEWTCFTNDGKKLISFGIDGCVRFWEVPTGKLLRSRLGFACSPEGRTVATSDEKDRRVILLVDSETGRVRTRFTGHTQHGQGAAAFSPDSSIVVSCLRPREVCIWAASNGRLLYRLDARLHVPGQVAFSRDSKYVACIVGEKADEIRVGNARSGEMRCVLTGHKAAIYSLAFSSNGKRLVSAGSDRTLRIWDLEIGKESRKSEILAQPLATVAFAADDSTIVTGGNDGFIRFWDPETGKEKSRIHENDNSETRLALSPVNSFGAAWSHNTIRLWDFATGKLVFRSPGHQGQVTGLAFCGNSKTLATSAYDGSVRLWDANSGKELARLEAGHHSQSMRLAISADGMTLVAASEANIVLVWDVPTRKLRIRFTVISSAGNYFALSPDGRFVAMDGGGIVRLFRTEDGVEVRGLPGAEGPLTKLEFSPDSRFLAVANSYYPSAKGRGRPMGLVRLWDVERGSEIAKFDGYRGPVESIAFSPDGRTLAVTGHEDKVVILHELASRSRRAEWQIADAPRPPFGISLHDLKFSGTGSLLAAAGLGQQVYLWDVRQAREVWRSGWRDGPLNSLAFCGDRLLAASGLGTVPPCMGNRPVPPAISTCGGEGISR